MAYAQSTTEGKTRCEILQDTVRDFGLFLYDKEKGEVMGRNGKSWAKITVFFLIFYSCLAAFFAAMLAAFMSTVPAREDGPKLTQYLAGKQGLNNVPKKIGDDFASSHKYVEEIKKFLEPYENQETVDKEHFANEFCDERGENETGGKGKQCRFNLTALSPCYSSKDGFDFGYNDDKSICIFVRMNKVFDWVPEPNDNYPFGVQLKCYQDPDNKKGNPIVTVYPKDKPGFPTNYYPYKIQDHWLSPIVAIYVEKAEKGQVILCEANAKNIKKSGTFRVERGAYGKTRIAIGKE